MLLIFTVYFIRLLCFTDNTTLTESTTKIQKFNYEFSSTESKTKKKRQLRVCLFNYWMDKDHRKEKNIQQQASACDRRSYCVIQPNQNDTEGKAGVTTTCTQFIQLVE